MKALALAAFLSLAVGCAPTIGPDGITGGGDSDQDVLSIKGPGRVSYDPETGVWEAECKAPQCSLTWATQSALNANRDAAIAEVVKDGILGGIAAGAEAAKPGL